MPDTTQQCYDQLAANFHLMFEDWNASIARQAAAIGPILERASGEPRPLRILDCACGIGTQALGLAQRGHLVTACDISSAAVLRAGAEAKLRGLQLSLHPADMRHLSALPSGFDAVICLDNSLPHLDSQEELLQSAIQIRQRLRSGGLFLASIRDYDKLTIDKPVVHGPAFLSSPPCRRIVHQIWDWLDDRRYTFHIYLTIQTAAGWDSHHYAATYRTVLREELSTALVIAGFREVQWLFPADTGYYQPLVLAVAHE